MKELECALEQLQVYAVRRRPCQVSGMGLRFLIVQSGEVVVRCASHRQTVRAGTLMRVAREAVIQPGQGEYTELQLGLPDALLQERLGTELSLRILDDETHRRVNQVLSLCAVCDDGVIIRHLLIALMRGVLLSPGSKGPVPSRLRAIQRYLDEHYAEDCSVRQLSERFHYNPSYLSRLFRQSCRCTINEYVRTLRLRKAAELLIGTNEPIARIAEMIGQPNMQHFYRYFKGEYGMTPQTYRAKYSKGADKE